MPVCGLNAMLNKLRAYLTKDPIRVAAITCSIFIWLGLLLGIMPGAVTLTGKAGTFLVLTGVEMAIVILLIWVE